MACSDLRYCLPHLDSDLIRLINYHYQQYISMSLPKDIATVAVKRYNDSLSIRLNKHIHYYIYTIFPLLNQKNIGGLF